MAKQQVFVVQSSLDNKPTYKRPAVGSLRRVMRRFTRGGKFNSSVVVGRHMYAGKSRYVFRTTLGFGTNQVAWFDWFEV
jgi:hypothetical protein